MIAVTFEGFPPTRGPFSYAVRSKGFVFVSGLAAFDPTTGAFQLGDARRETALTLQNLARTLAAAGSSPARVVKCTVYLRDIADYDAMNEVYGAFFAEAGVRPARTTIQAVLGSGIAVEIEAIAEGGDDDES